MIARIVVAAVALFGLSACSSGLDGSAAVDPAIAPPAQVALPDLAKAVSAKLSGQGSAKFTVDSTTELLAAHTVTSVTGAFRRDDKGLWMTATMTTKSPDTTTLSFVLTPTAVYVRLPADQKLPPDKPWVRATDGGSDAFSQGFAPVFASLKQATLAPFAAPLDPASTAVTGSDIQPAGVVPARHYSLRTDLAAMAKTLPDGPLKDTTLLEAKLGGMVEELWVGAGNVPLRSEARLDVPATTGTLTVSRSYSDWGQPVDVPVPPDSQLSPPPAGG
ncbi:hypothetical protein [Kutzneria buriramensis]|uniref:Lipoprotein LprG n=1 Tax=Kutzneria buriramensis TaxID=1045776 RepID=A0A3E0IAS7_9PSEU|nr:hypothetical protein [Kutzneria buriramensis]REH55838.1 hypothetical protein BCF44_101864 [Kutzneria buriramensis]